MSNRYNVTSTDQNFEPLANPMTAEGDIIVGGSSPAGEPTALPISATPGDLLASDGTTLGYISQSTSLDNIGDTAGDILYRGASNWSVLGTGSEGQWLRQAASAAPSWAALQTAGNIGSLPAADATNVGTWYVGTNVGNVLFLHADTGSSTYTNLNVLSASGASFDEIRTNMVANLSALNSGETTTPNTGGSALCGSISIPLGATSAVQVLVKGVASDHSLACSWSLNAVAYNNSGTVQIIGNPVRGGTAQSDVGTTWDATIISGTTAGGGSEIDSLYVQVTGQNTTGGYSITWAATLVLIA